MINSVPSKFHDLNLDGYIQYVPEDQKDKVIVNLIHQNKDLERGKGAGGVGPSVVNASCKAAR